MSYRFHGADALFDWLASNVDADVAELVAEWVFRLCEDPAAQPESRQVPGSHPWRRRAIVPGTHVVLVYLVVEEHQVIEFLNAALL